MSYGKEEFTERRKLMDWKKAALAIYFLLSSVISFFLAGMKYTTSNSGELNYMLDWRFLLFLGSITLCASAIISYIAVVEYWDEKVNTEKSEVEVGV
jgi:hypothetical protein